MLLTKSVNYYGKEIPVENLKKNSNKKVKIKCPKCEKVRETHYKSYLKSETDMCQPCTVKIKNTKYLKSGSKYGRLTVLKPAKETGKSVCMCKCGSKTVVGNYLLKSGRTKSCGCLKGEHLKDLKPLCGSEHGMWKGGISSKRDRIKESKKYKQWRKSVFERDNYTCQKCGQVGYKLNAHHILSFSKHKDKITKLNNGITLCASCHYSFHSKYGRTKANKKDLNKFLGI